MQCKTKVESEEQFFIPTVDPNIGNIGIGYAIQNPPKPKKIRRLGICYANKQEHVIHIETSKILADSLKLSQFGDFGYWGEHDFYRLKVDSRYDFDQVLGYLQQF